MADSSTKERLLNAAERLFAERSYDGTSLREVTRQADVNLAAIHYHFGGKMELLRAIFERRVERINEERLALLEAVEGEAGGGPPRLESVLEAFLGPPLRYAAFDQDEQGWSHFMVIVGRLNSASGPTAQMLDEVFREVRGRFFPAIRRAVPDLDQVELGWRIHFLIGSMCAQFSAPARVRLISNGQCNPEDPEEALRQLVAFASAGLRAPAPAVPTAGPRSGDAR